MEALKTLQQAILHFANLDNCHEFMVKLRWPDGKVTCPRCGSDDVSYLPNARVFKCYKKHEKQKFSLKVGTVFEDSPIGLEKWLPVTWLLCNCKNGISSYEIARAIGVTQKSAWFMLHRVRKAMEDSSFVKLGSSGGPVEVDETFIGGKYKNMHASKRMKLQNGVKANEKVAVMGFLDRNVREVRAKVIPNVKRETLQSEILKHVVGTGTVYTDSATGYDNLDVHAFVHETVNHMQEYVRGEVHTQGI